MSQTSDAMETSQNPKRLGNEAQYTWDLLLWIFFVVAVAAPGRFDIDTFEFHSFSPMAAILGGICFYRLVMGKMHVSALATVLGAVLLTAMGQLGVLLSSAIQHPMWLICLVPIGGYLGWQYLAGPLSHIYFPSKNKVNT